MNFASFEIDNAGGLVGTASNAQASSERGVDGAEAPERFT
jgi:hypothetical protein